MPLEELPCFTLWKNTAAEADGYVTGLEPGTNFPNLRSFERFVGENWNLVINTHFLPAEIIASLRRTGELATPHFTVTRSPRRKR